MNKNDLTQQLADRTGLAKNDAAKAVDGVFDLITEALKAGDEVRADRFRRIRGGRTARAARAAIRRPARKSPSSRPSSRASVAGKQLKDALNSVSAGRALRAPAAPVSTGHAHAAISGRVAVRTGG